MSKKASTDEQIVRLLQHLLAIELYRSGLSQSEIRARLGLQQNVVSAMLKGLSLEMRVKRE